MIRGKKTPSNAAVVIEDLFKVSPHLSTLTCRSTNKFRMENPSVEDVATVVRKKPILLQSMIFAFPLNKILYCAC